MRKFIEVDPLQELPSIGGEYLTDLGIVYYYPSNSPERTTFNLPQWAFKDSKKRADIAFWYKIIPETTPLSLKEIKTADRIEKLIQKEALDYSQETDFQNGNYTSSTKFNAFIRGAKYVAQLQQDMENKGVMLHEGDIWPIIDYYLNDRLENEGRSMRGLCMAMILKVLELKNNKNGTRI